MTPEIEKTIVSLIEAAKQAGSDASSFIAQQAPDVIAQLVRWKITEGIIEFALGGVALWGAYKIIRVTVKKVSAGVDDIVWVPVSLAVILLSIGGAVAFCEGTMQTAKATLAPKVLILETVANLTRCK